jgi:hypothetical protein
MVWNRVILAGLMGGLLSTLVGCSGNGDERPTAPVKVTVSYKGKPVDGALVQFISEENPQPAVGTTDSTGSCALTTYKSNDGAIIGSNFVTITKAEIDQSKIKPVRPEDADLIGVTPIPTLKSLIPQKYAAPGSSGFKEVVKKGSNTFTFELKD